MGLWDNNQNNGNTGGGIYRPAPTAVARWTAESILDEIVAVVNASIDNGQSGIYILNHLNKMVEEGKITLFGNGSNRRVYTVNADMKNVLNRIGFPDNTIDTVICVPFNVHSGSKDNLREAFAPEFIHTEANYVNPNDNDAQVLKSLIPLGRIYDYPTGNVIVQEKIIPIEQDDEVIALINSNPGLYGNDVGSAVLKVITSSEKWMKQMYHLMKALDKYFVIADLNILYSRFNFGFKYVNGEKYLTVLDLGYVLPRYFEDMMPKCPSCGEPLHYVNIAEEFFNADDARKERLKMMLNMGGLYSCKNLECDHNGKGGDPFLVEDMKVFEEYRKRCVAKFMSNPSETKVNMLEIF